MTRLQACLYLRFLPGIGNITARKLWEAAGSVEAIFEEPQQLFSDKKDFRPALLERLKPWKKYTNAVAREEEKIHEQQIQTLYLGDPDYPKTLSFCPDAPLVLFYKGISVFGPRKRISIVGTRSGDAAGEKMCRKLISELRELQPTIVSGFARGIDIIAHDQALKSQLSTIACMAHGLDRTYPPEHQDYVGKILEQGAFVSDFTTAEKFDRQNFLIRNRLIAGLSHATVVVQSRLEGGSMITAHFAHQYQRELFAFPGAVSDRLHQGCNALIHSQQGQLLRDASDLIEAMGWGSQTARPAVQKQLFVDLSPEEKIIFDHLKSRAADSLDNIARATDRSVGQTAALLLQLEMKGCVKPLPGKFFEWV